MERKGLVGGIAFAAILVVAFVLMLMCTSRVPAGYVGVVYNIRDGVAGEVLTQGWHLVSPTKSVTIYSIGIEQSYLTSDEKGDSKADESFSIPTSDGKTVRVNLEFSYRFDADRVASTFVTFKGKSGDEIKDTFIKPKIIAWTQEVSANYPVTDIFGDKRTDINSELDLYLKEKFDQYGIVIDTVNFTDISVDAETAAAIQKKVTAQQELELANIEAQTAKIEAQKDKEVALIQAEKNKEAAQIQAETALVQANAEADAKKITADAEAYAIRVIQEQLAQSPRYIELQKVEKWDGKWPDVMGDTVNPFVTIGGEY